MAKTYSTMRELGSQMPSFSLIEPLSGKIIKDSDFKNRQLLLVMFICNHCPYVVHIAHGLTLFAHDHEKESVGIVAINSNDVERYPEDSPELMVREVKKRNYIFPYLYDESQKTASAFGASCTPDFFLFNEKRELVYRGQFDASRPGNNIPVTGESLRNVVSLLLNNQRPPVDQIPSMGCNIKWKAGNEPVYYTAV